MIYTQHGVEVKISKVIDRDKGRVEVTALDKDKPDWVRERGIFELKADGGLPEILAEIDALAVTEVQP